MYFKSPSQITPFYYALGTNPAMYVLMVIQYSFSVAVVVAFFVCWAPFHAQRLMTIYIKQWTPELIGIQDIIFHISGKQFYAIHSRTSNLKVCRHEAPWT